MANNHIDSDSPEIEAALVSAEQYIQKLNFIKGNQVTQQAENLIEETKAEVDKILLSIAKNYWIVKTKPRRARLITRTLCFNAQRLIST